MTYANFAIAYAAVIAALTPKQIADLQALCALGQSEADLKAFCTASITSKSTHSGLVDLVADITDLQVGCEKKILQASLENMPLKRKLNTETTMMSFEGKIITSVLGRMAI